MVALPLDVNTEFIYEIVPTSVSLVTEKFTLDCTRVATITKKMRAARSEWWSGVLELGQFLNAEKKAKNADGSRKFPHDGTWGRYVSELAQGSGTKAEDLRSYMRVVRELGDDIKILTRSDIDVGIEEIIMILGTHVSSASKIIAINQLDQSKSLNRQTAQDIIAVGQELEAIENEESRIQVTAIAQKYSVINPEIVPMLNYAYENYRSLIEELVESDGYVFIPEINNGEGEQKHIRHVSALELQIAMNLENGERIARQSSYKKGFRKGNMVRAGYYTGELDITLAELFQAAQDLEEKLIAENPGKTIRHVITHLYEIVDEAV